MLSVLCVTDARRKLLRCGLPVVAVRRAQVRGGAVAAALVVEVGVLAVNAARPKPASVTVVAVRFAVASVAEVPLATRPLLLIASKLERGFVMRQVREVGERVKGDLLDQITLKEFKEDGSEEKENENKSARSRSRSRRRD